MSFVGIKIANQSALSSTFVPGRWVSIFLILFLLSTSSTAQIPQDIQRAIQDCDSVYLKRKFKEGIDPNIADSNRANLLMWGIYAGDLPFVQFLVENGAKPCTECVLYYGEDGSSFGNLAGVAAAMGKTDILSYLSNRLEISLNEPEFDPNTRLNSGWTPLFWAVKSQNESTVKFLLERNSNVNVYDSDTTLTPLLFAARLGDYEIFSAVLKADSYELSQQNKIFFDTLWKELHIQVEKNGADNLLFLTTCLRYFNLKSKISLKFLANVNEEIYFKFRNLFQLEKAEQFALETYRIRKMVFGVNHPIYASTATNLAGLYRWMGQYIKAEKYALEGYHIRKMVLGRDHPDYASSCLYLGLIYSDMGEYVKEEQFDLEAYRVYKYVIGGNHPDYAIACDNLAGCYSVMGQLSKAEKYGLEAYQIRKSILGENHPDYAISCGNMCVLYSNMGRNTEAIKYGLEANRVYKQVFGFEHPAYALSCKNIAISYKRLGQFRDAVKYGLEAYRINKQVYGKDHPEYAESCVQLNRIYYKLGEYVTAEKYAFEAYEIRSKKLGEYHLLTGHSYYDLGLLNFAKGNLIQAFNLFSKSREVDIRQLNEIFTNNSPSARKEYLENSDGESSDVYQSLSLIARKSMFGYSVAINDRNRLSKSALQQRSYLDQSSGELKTKYENLKETKKALQELLGSSEPEKQRRLYTLKDSIEVMEKALSKESFGRIGFQAKSQAQFDDIVGRLGNEDAAIEFVSFTFHNGKRWTDSVYYMAYIIRKGYREPVMELLFEKKELDLILKASGNQNTTKYVNNLYMTRGGEVLGKQKQSQISLYQLIWQPLERHLKSVRNIYYAPAGKLFNISFPALQISKDSFLCDRFRLIQLNQTAELVNYDIDALNHNDHITLFGGIDYDAITSTGLDINKPAQKEVSENDFARIDSNNMRSNRGNGWGSLPGTLAEVHQIEMAATEAGSNVIVLTGSHASEQTIKSLDGDSSPDVLHIASHGFFFPDVFQKKENYENEYGSGFKVLEDPLLRSGIILAGANEAWTGKRATGGNDGILTALEVSNLYFKNVKLVILSACETGLGEIQGSEGVLGLQSAFKTAGVQNLILSLWEVPDIETSEFMVILYDKMFNNMSIQDAFYETQMFMRKKYSKEPEKWAAWVMVQ